MPLPPNGTPWPPRELHTVTHHMRGWDAWYSGDPIRLAEHYGYLGAGVPGYPAPRQAQLRGGVIGGIARWFWGAPTHGQQLNRLHVPIAADICQAGADLLFAEPPSFTVDSKDDDGNKSTATQDRLDELADDTLHGVLAESAEIGGALGGSYLRVSWDREVEPDKPFLTCVHGDAAWPEFRYGRLVAVTFWTVIARQGQSVWRHLERHELDAQRIGIIRHGLYEGSEASLGLAKPLAERPETAGLALLVTDGDTISTESPGLAAVYIPNQRPQRRWRNDPIGCNLGRSDLDGVEHLMDALDETYTSWMRDIRLGKARAFVAQQMLESHGPGKGASFDVDQEIYAPLNILASADSTASSLIQVEQFKIRYEEHGATADNLVNAILRTAGYSSQTFGMDDSGGKASNMTATEVQAHERRSYMTRDRKIRLENPQVVTIMQKLLAVDVAIFNTAGVQPIAPSVQFADSVQESQITLAQTAQALKAAEAASTKTLVAMLHPDWDDDAIDAEVTLIKAEITEAAPPPLSDPTTFGAPADPTTILALDPTQPDPAPAQ